MAGNRVVAFMGPRKVKVQSLDYPKLIGPGGRKCDHGVIVKIVTTNICGSDQHIYHGRFAAPKGMVMGHERRCRNCKERHTDVCMNVNEADLLKFPDKDQAMAKIRDLTLLSGILPTGFHGCVAARVTTGSTVYIAGAGPVGRCAAAGARLLGASCIIVADRNRARLELVKKAGYEIVDTKNKMPVADQIEAILGKREVDCGVDCVGLEAHGYGADDGDEHSEAVINTLLEVVRAGGGMGIPGIYTDADPMAKTDLAKQGKLPLAFGKAWIKSPSLTAGQAPIMKYNRQLMMAILWDRMPYLGEVVNTEIISMEQAPAAYQTFSEGSPKKFVIDPHGSVKKAA